MSGTMAYSLEDTRYGPLKKKSKLIRKRALHRFKIFLNDCFRREVFDPLFVIATRRSGSSLLVSYLNSIPGVSIAGEVLNWDMYYGVRKKWITKDAVLRHLAHSVNYCRGRVGGAKLLLTQLNAHGLSLTEIRDYFPYAKFLILYRKSVMDQFISLKIAEKTNEWVWTRNYRLPDSVEIDPMEARRFCRKIKGFYDEALTPRWVQDRSVLMSYEELVSAPQTIFDLRLCPFLGVPSCRISTALRKQNTQGPSQIVKNYAEIRSLFQDEFFRQNYSFREDPPQEMKVRFA